MTLRTNRNHVFDVGGIIAVVVMILRRWLSASRTGTIVRCWHLSSTDQIMDTPMSPRLFWIRSLPLTNSTECAQLSLRSLPVSFMRDPALLGLVIAALCLFGRWVSTGMGKRCFSAWSLPINFMGYAKTVLALMRVAIGLTAVAMELGNRLVFLTGRAPFDKSRVSHGRTSFAGSRWLEPRAGYTPVGGSFIVPSKIRWCNV